MRLHRLAAVAAILLAAAACQPLPQPFANERTSADNPLLQPTDGGGITVRTPEGLKQPDSRALAEAIAAALRDAEIPASTEGSNSLSRFLTTRVAAQPAAADRVRIALDWSLADAKGGRATKGAVNTEAAAAQWNAHAPELTERIAVQIAEAIARSSAADSGGAPMALAIDRPIHVRKIVGLSQRDEATLRRSLEFQLRQSKLKVADDPTDEALVVAGAFKLSPPVQGGQKVELSWAVLRPDGGELGTMSQANTVEAGTFDKPWGELAAIIAQGAAAGLTEILTRLTPDKLAENRGR